MAGERQHYLPQFLQKGFSDAASSNRTWVFRKDVKSKLVGFRDVGVERKFYSDGNDNTLDETITEAETTEFSSLLNLARLSEPGVVLEGNFARLFAHLEVRSRHLRQSFSQISENFWTQTFAKFQNAEFLKILIRKRLARNVRHELQKQGLAPRLIDSALKEVLTPFKLKLMYSKLAPLIERDVLPRVRQAAKTGHLDALTKSIAPEVRANQYKRLTFRAKDVAPSDLILGDSAVVFQVESQNSYKPFVDKDDVVIAAILPIMPQRIIVGSERDCEWDADSLRQQVARCSLEFFLASEDSEDNRTLASEIGKTALPLSDAEIEGIIVKAIESQLG